MGVKRKVRNDVIVSRSKIRYEKSVNQFSNDFLWVNCDRGGGKSACREAWPNRKL